MTSYYDMYLKDSNDDNADTQYRREILLFFNLGHYDDTKISMRTDKIFTTLRKNSHFEAIFKAVLNEKTFMTFNPEATEITPFCLTVLLSFEYFHLFKGCFDQYSNREPISSEHLIAKLSI